MGQGDRARWAPCRSRLQRNCKGFRSNHLPGGRKPSVLGIEALPGAGPLARLGAVQVESQEGRPERIGPYRLDGLLGVGGMGEVYRAHDERLDRWVALKQISGASGNAYDRLRQRFRREARAAARLNHPAIVQIYDVIEGRGVDWIVMELVEGETLAQRVSDGPFELRLLLETARELASGLAAAHGEGIIHRDLKAENIMLTRDGRVKILDFGLAKQLWSTDSEISLSIEGTLLGTARAMAPEQALGKKADHRSDLFAFGILLYEMSTGKSPFLGPTAVETAIRVCSHRQTPARQHNGATPPQLSELIDRLLEKEPARRLASIHLVRVELDDLLNQLGDRDTSVPQESGERQPASWRGSIIEPSVDGELIVPSSESTPLPSLGEVAPQRRSRQSQSEARDRGLKIRRERRPVTVMCCDLVSSTADDLGLDPEVLFDVTHEFQEQARWIVERFGGHLEQGPDHRLLVYFGYPKAMEDAPLRAVAAAQALVAEVDGKLHQLTSLEGDERIAVRVGIHSGPAVVQAQDDRVRVILGQTLDLASTLKNRAATNTILISETTARLVADHCELDALPALRSRRFERPLKAYRCRHLRGRRRFDLAGDGVPLLGRDSELALLRSRWRLSREGSGQVVAIVAESGYGKTRLVQALAEKIQDESALTLAVRGTFEHQQQGFGSVVTLLHQLFEIAPDDRDETQLDKIEGLLSKLNAPLEAMVPLLGELLSLSTQQRYPSTNPAMEPPGKTLDALLALLLETSRWRPLFLVVEDLQWVDASTVELLAGLVERSSAVPLMTLLTYRPGFTPQWLATHPGTCLTLEALRWPEASDLVGELFPHGIAPAKRQRLLERGSGVPRFLVELSRRPRNDKSADDVPLTLQDHLMAKLDALGEAKELVQLAAVLGQSMPLRLLREAQILDPAAFDEQVERLLEKGILRRRGFPGAVELSFRHTLVRDMANASLLSKERQKLHRRVAEIIDRQALAGEEIDPLILARHRYSAGDLAQAVTHFEEAARLDVEEGNPQAAIESLQQGLDILLRLPENEERDRHELSLLITLGPLLSGARGFEDPTLEDLYTRAGELCLQQKNERQHFRVLRSISAFFIARARPKRSLQLVEKLMQIAEQAKDPELLLEASYAIGLTHFTLGDLGAAQLHLERGIGLDEGRHPQPPAGESSEDPGVACRALAALVAWHLGRVDDAVALSDGAVETARLLSHQGTLAAALSFAAWLHQLRRDHAKVEQLAEETVAISQQGGFLLWSTYGQLLLGWSRLGKEPVASETPADGSRGEASVEPEVSYLGLSLDVYRDAGVLFAQTYLLSLLAEASTERGNIDRALRHLLEALTAVEGSGERFWQAELLRLCGTMVLASATAETEKERRREAEGYFERALDVARRQGCRSLELRAAASLGRLWAERGMKSQAHQMVEVLYEAFDQGFDSADLVETRQWLDQVDA